MLRVVVRGNAETAWARRAGGLVGKYNGRFGKNLAGESELVVASKEVNVKVRTLGLVGVGEAVKWTTADQRHAGSKPCTPMPSIRVPGLCMSPTSLLPSHWLCLSVTVCYCLTMILVSKVTIHLCYAKLPYIFVFMPTTFQLFSSTWT